MRAMNGLRWCLLLFVAATYSAWAQPKADLVVVEKSEQRVYLYHDGEVFASYHAKFGGDPVGHKIQQGDQRTPEGRYTLDWKNPNSKYYKSIHISYPNRYDRERARELGVDPGGDIMIHGQPNGYGWIAPFSRFVNWTDGCVAVSNEDMELIWNAVDAGTPIEIRP